MKRRKALKSLGLSLSAGLFVPQLLSACKKDNPGPEVNYKGTVAIIGAGAAGLYTADILRSKGITVVVLEAGSELGGRIKSLRNQSNIPSQSIADFPVELGAELTYGADSIWGKIIQNLNVPMINLKELSGADPKYPDQFYLKNTVQTGSAWNGDGDYGQVQNFIAALPNFSTSGTSVLDAATSMGVTEAGKALLNSQVGNFYGSTSSQVGAAGLAEGIKLLTHNSDWLSMKANPLQDLLLSRFSLVTPKVMLSHQVTQVLYNGTKATISGLDITDGGSEPFTMEVDKVIVTVPLSILKSGDIAFSPALPGTMVSSMANLGMDASVRVVLDFKKNFWGAGTGFIWGGTTSPQIFSAGAGRSQFERTLSITINGPKASELSAMGTDMVASILDELDAMYAGQATLNIRRDEGTDQPLSIIQDWSKETFIKGGYSYPRLNATIDDRKNIGAPITNLFFAGEATDIMGDAGTINGALASAERVTEEVVKSILKPS